jgi:hypothetical protein
MPMRHWSESIDELQVIFKEISLLLLVKAALGYVMVFGIVFSKTASVLERK